MDTENDCLPVNTKLYLWITNMHVCSLVAVTGPVLDTTSHGSVVRHSVAALWKQLLGLTTMFVMWGLLCQGLAFIHHKHLWAVKTVFWNVIDNIQKTCTYASDCHHAVNDPGTRILSISSLRVLCQYCARLVWLNTNQLIIVKLKALPKLIMWFWASAIQ